MERTESYYFFELLNLCKRRLSYEHHNCYLSVCTEDMVPKGLRLKKQANIEDVSRCFENDWGSILLDASKKLRDLSLMSRNAHNNKIGKITKYRQQFDDFYNFGKYGYCGEFLSNHQIYVNQFHTW